MKARARSHSRRGFSLLEIMVVLVIIGLVTSLVAINMGKAGDDAKNDIARTQASTIATALDAYRLKRGSYPRSLTALVEPPPTMREIPADPWGNEYALVMPGVHNPYGVDIVSPGPDGVAGTDDDVGNWRAPRTENG